MKRRILFVAVIAMADTLYTIPQNWRWTTLENVAKNQYGYTAKAVKNNSLPKMLRITDIQNGGVDWENVPNCEIDDEQKEKYLLQDNDIVIARTGSVGKSYLVKNPVNSVFASYLIRLRISEKINVNYVYYFLQSDVYWRQISELASGSVQLGVNSTKLQNIEIPVPPLDEQKRIVALLDSLFEKLDAAKSILQKISDGYELRRAAILHRAFTGKLTENFRAGNGLTLEDWQEKTLSDLLLPMETRRPTGETFRYIDIDSIDNRRQVVKAPKIIETAKAPSRASRAVDSDNVLFSMVRPYLKNIALIDDNLKDCIASTGFFVCRCNENILPKFLYNFLRSLDTINYLMQFMKGDNSPSIRQENFLGTPINLPSVDEQKEIVRILEKLLANEQRTKDIAENVLAQIDALKKNILARAFRGEI